MIEMSNQLWEDYEGLTGIFPQRDLYTGNGHKVTVIRRREYGV